LEVYNYHFGLFFATSSHSHETVDMPHIPTHKPRDKPMPYMPCKCYEKKKKEALKTSTRPITKNTCENLTLHDWMTVYKYVDEHPSMSQQAIVDHFETQLEGVLIFTQATLSWKLNPKTHLSWKSVCQRRQMPCLPSDLM
jgi:hypothetical protein